MARLTTITLRHLNVFVEIVNQSSLRRASVALNVTESAISKSLRELEAELGIALLIRDRRGIIVTPAGRDFLTHATQTVSSFQRAMYSLNKSSPRERVRIGTVASASGYLVPHAVNELLKSYGDYDVHVVSDRYEALIARLRRAEVDFVIGRLSMEDAIGLSFEPLYDEPIDAVVSADHPLARSCDVSAADLLEYDLLLPDKGSGVRLAVESFLFKSGVGKGRVITGDGGFFSSSYAHLFRAVWFVRHGKVDLALRRGDLVKLPLYSHLLRDTVGLTTLSDQPLTDGARTLAELLREMARDEPQQASPAGSLEGELAELP